MTGYKVVSRHHGRRLQAPLLGLGYEAGHQSVGDGGANPYLYQHIVGVFIDWLEIDVEVIECRNDHIDDADHPQVALGVALPVLTRIEIGEHAEQQHRQRKTQQMERTIGQRRREENIAQQHRDCGAMIFDPDTQDTHCGGSGCGCGASVLCGNFLPMLERGEAENILFAATGALMSPMSLQQGESIPSISHLVHLRKEQA